MCRLLDKSQAYTKTMGVRTGKYASHMKVLMQAHKFGVNDLMTILRFPAQSKRARNPYKIPEA